MASKPLVSIVTPVYNGEAFLDDCIQSVLAQDYGDWEYVIVNNGSTDHSLEIARKYARRDKRIRISDNPEFLPLVRNWNHALEQISPRSKYCKVLHADDLLYPPCVRSMVEFAEAHPEVGLVASRFLRGDTVWPVDLPFAEGVVAGHEAVRFYFECGLNFLGTPTNVLLPSAIVRENRPFHNEANRHSPDLEAWLVLLDRYPLGFLDSVLSYTRLHEQSVTTRSKRLKLHALTRVYLLLAYGHRFMDAREYRRTLIREIWSYERILSGGLLSGDFELFRFHRKQLRMLGIAPWRALATTVLRNVGGERERGAAELFRELQDGDGDGAFSRSAASDAQSGERERESAGSKQ